MSAFCPECMRDQHFVCSVPATAGARSTGWSSTPRTTTSSLTQQMCATANHAYSELEIREANRQLRDQLVERRRYDDETLGVTPWTYRAKKWLGKFFTPHRSYQHRPQRQGSLLMPFAPFVPPPSNTQPQPRQIEAQGRYTPGWNLHLRVHHHPGCCWER